MKETFLNELKKLYRDIEYSNHPTDFYVRVYVYIKHLWSSSVFKQIIKQDDLEWIHSDKEKQKYTPLNHENEDDLDIFFKRMKYMESGEQQFLNYYLGKINLYIYMPFSQAENGMISEDFIIMRGGAKKYTLTDKFFIFLHRRDNPAPLEDLNNLYIDNYENWKIFISRFNSLLIEKLDLYHANEKANPTRYDAERTVLYVSSVGLVVSRKSDKSNIHYILKYIFDNNAKEEHFYSYMEEEKILGDWKDWNTYYKALKTLEERLNQEMGISDFFEKITTGESGSVKINSKYL